MKRVRRGWKRLATGLGVCILLGTGTVPTAAGQPPAVASISPDNGPVGTLVRITGSNLAAVTDVQVNGVPALVVARAANECAVLVMPGTASGAISVSNADGTDLSGLSFAVSGVLPPLVSSGSIPLPTGLTGMVHFGFDVAVSADGRVAAVSGEIYNSGLGAVWMYRDNGSGWQLVQMLSAYSETAAAPIFGCAVAMDATGQTVLVGGRQGNDAFGSGAAYVFRWDGSSYQPDGPRLRPTNSTGANLGQAVALSADGQTALLGAPGLAGGGRVYAYRYDGSAWNQVGAGPLPVGGIPSTSDFGMKLALSADGNTALVSALAEASFAGRVRVLVENSGTWSLQQTLEAQEGAGQQLGTSLALSADGNTAVIGAYGTNGFTGTAYLYRRSGTTWTQVIELRPSDLAAGGNYGQDVAITADGNLAAASAELDDGNTGAFWIWRLNAGTWESVGGKTVAPESPGRFGASLALTPNGELLLVGAPDLVSERGAAYGYGTTATPLPVVLVQFAAAQQPQGVVLTWATASESNSAYFEVLRSADGQHFTAIGQVPAAGDSRNPQQYGFTDADAAGTGERYYRLRMVDADGTAEHSRTVRVSGLAETPLWTAQPNPFTNTVQLTAAGTRSLQTATDVQLLAADGTRVLATRLPLAAVATRVNQALGPLPAGVYWLRLALEGRQDVLRLVKL